MANMFNALSRVEDRGQQKGEGGGLGDERREMMFLDLVKTQCPMVLCIQETKLEVIEEYVCATIWGSNGFGFSYRPTVRELGGTLTLWDA
ncbi:hypothetical protein MTR_6g009190 [Medicago truncatula]|uniref:Endonuclease/exonuclease/phosphatase family protein n=1 Tax=Medicago truncatula TaxID=3880 RepID=G7KJZ0_MEDTR|nr:hypothetical protein MTR_6g009190 [Medicago truncatula]